MHKVTTVSIDVVNGAIVTHHTTINRHQNPQNVHVHFKSCFTAVV